MGGGGGGNTSTATAGIDKEFKPQLVEGLDKSLQRLRRQDSGEQEIVAGPTRQQLESAAYKESLAKDKLYGRGLYDDKALKQKALQNVYGSASGQASAGNTFGSARALAAQNKAITDAADKWDINRRQVATQATKDLGDVGTFFQQANQRGLDSQGMALDQFFGRLQNAPKTTTTTGGGK